jgi:hypothetical protein
MPRASKSFISKETYRIEDLCRKREMESKSKLKERWRTTLIRSILKRKRQGFGRSEIHCGASPVFLEGLELATWIKGSAFANC